MSMEAKFRDSAIDRIEHLGRRISRSNRNRILCSRDPDIAELEDELLDLIPADFKGVKRFFLPVAPVLPHGGKGRYLTYFTLLPPNVEVPAQVNGSEHAVLKVVIQGALSHGGHRLTPGDWAWIPAGEPFGCVAGNHGALLLTSVPYCDIDPRYDSVIEKIDAAQVALTRATAGGAVNSRNALVESTQRSLRDIGAELVERAPSSTHWFLPIAPEMPAQVTRPGRYFAWVSVLEPGIRIPSHSHALEKLGDMKVVISGSIRHQDKELTSGDWLWIPSGLNYEFEVGKTGAVLAAWWPHN